MSKIYDQVLRRRKGRIEERLARQAYPAQEQPMMRGRNIHYEVSDRMGAVGCGGLGAIHLMVQRLGLVEDINQQVPLFKVHLPYYESDHVLNIAYNILAGGQRLGDIEYRRRDEALLDGLGAERLPGCTTAGDFTRRFTPESILQLQDCFNRARVKVWKKQPKGFLKDAWIDVDGTIASTGGDCKEGMGLSYQGIWGYAPLIVSLSNTKEVLYLVNRPGPAASHQGSVEWIDRAIDWVRPWAKRMTLRGDTDFTHTAHLDRWDSAGLHFILGMDAHKKVVDLAQGLPPEAWQKLERPARYVIQTQPRRKPQKVKEQIVKARGYKNLVLRGEAVAEIADYQPHKCQRGYRLILLRKEISVQRRGREIERLVRYFFYLTNRRDLSPAEVVARANQRCDQENVIEQLKNGVNALRMPGRDLVSNWAYMVMAALAWNLKAWFGLLMPHRERGWEVVRMEFRRFLQVLILLPCQIVRAGRRIIYRILSYKSWLQEFLSVFQRIRRLAPE